jgi:hypothetical protein
MQIFRTSALALLPAALVAQAPAPNFSQTLRAEQPGIEKLVKELKYKDALAKAEALIATPKPAYDNKDLNTLQQSMYIYRDLVQAHILAANTAITAGEWEKADKILNTGLTIAKENQTLFNTGAKPTLDSWAKAEDTAKKFLADYNAKAPAMKEHMDKTLALRAEVEKGKKLSKDERTALNADLTKAQSEADELNRMEADKKVHEDNISKATMVKNALTKIDGDCQNVIKIVNTSIEKNQAKIKTQADEIKAFNDKQAADAKTKKGAKKKTITWVEAVMNDHQNIEKLSAADQVGFLSRLLVLEPANEKAQKALANIQAGKAPFEAEKKAAAKGKKR